MRTGRRGRRPLQGKPQRYHILYRHSKDFAIKNTVRTYGNEDFTITLSEDERITRRSQNTFTKIQFVGTMTNYTQKNKGYGLCSIFCNTKAKLAINNKERTKWTSILFSLFCFLMNLCQATMKSNPSSFFLRSRISSRERFYPP